MQKHYCDLCKQEIKTGTDRETAYTLSLFYWNYEICRYCTDKLQGILRSEEGWKI